jgi:hypothetical protein
MPLEVGDSLASYMLYGIKYKIHVIGTPEVQLNGTYCRKDKMEIYKLYSRG